MKYSRTHILSQILEAANGATKTKIMYEAHFSYARLKEYLSLPVQNSQIKFENRTQA